MPAPTRLRSSGRPPALVACAAVIRLRAAIFRGLKHRWLGPLLVILLAVMLVLAVFHSSAAPFDHHAAADVCCFILVAFFVAVAVTRPAVLVRPFMHVESRGPPTLAPCGAAALELTLSSPPLRL